jgi:hypothetical protein
VASYAAAIRKELDVEPVIESGSRGQFDVFVNEKLAISRKGGLVALLTRRPWPSVQDVVDAILDAKEPRG